LHTSAYRLKIRTNSADDNALILLSGGHLVAILVELADECHGDERGKWAVEIIFGTGSGQARGNFVSAGDAADWVSEQGGHHRFELHDNVEQLL
jgi:hypothetical protein